MNGADSQGNVRQCLSERLTPKSFRYQGSIISPLLLIILLEALSDDLVIIDDSIEKCVGRLLI